MIPMFLFFFFTYQKDRFPFLNNKRDGEDEILFSLILRDGYPYVSSNSHNQKYYDYVIMSPNVFCLDFALKEKWHCPLVSKPTAGFI